MVVIILECFLYKLRSYVVVRSMCLSVSSDELLKSMYQSKNSIFRKSLWFSQNYLILGIPPPWSSKISWIIRSWFGWWYMEKTSVWTVIFCYSLKTELNVQDSTDEDKPFLHLHVSLYRRSGCWTNEKYLGLLLLVLVQWIHFLIWIFSKIRLIFALDFASKYPFLY